MGAAFRGMGRRRGQVVAVAGGVAWIVGAAVAAVAGRGAAVAILVGAARGLVVGVAGFALAVAAAVGTVGEVHVVVGAKRERGRTHRRIRVGPLVVGAGQRAHALKCLDRAPRGAVAVAVSGVALVGASS